MADLVFDEDRNQWAWAGPIPTVSGTAAVTYGAAEQAMVNNLVTTVNALVAALRASGKLTND